MMIREIIRRNMSNRFKWNILCHYSNSNRFDPKKDYYSILQLHKDASFDQIRQAYLKLSKMHHPDSRTGNQQQFTNISQAYVILSNQQLRKQYNMARFTTKFDEEMDNRFKNNYGKPAESKKTDQYSYESTPKQKQMEQKLNKYVKRILIFGVGCAIFLPFITWGGSSNNIDPINEGYPKRHGGYFNGAGLNSRRYQSNIPQQSKNQYYQTNHPNIIVTGSIVED